MLAPTLFNEQSNYVGFDKQLHQIPNGHNCKLERKTDKNKHE